MSGSGSSAARRSAGNARASPTLPSATHTLRSSPRRLVRNRGVPANRDLKAASSRPSHSTRSGRARSARWWARSMNPSRAKRFQGQAARQSSQPKMRSPMAGRRSSGMEPRCSMVRYEMHRRASSVKGAGRAPVGQALRQRVQDPQRLCSGASGSSSAVVRISARRNQLPRLREIRLVCLPTNPTPARWAKSRSRMGPVSTYQSDRCDTPASVSRNSVRARKGSLSRSW